MCGNMHGGNDLNLYLCPSCEANHPIEFRNLRTQQKLAIADAAIAYVEALPKLNPCQRATLRSGIIEAVHTYKAKKEKPNDK
jgi:hypothetical protein